MAYFNPNNADFYPTSSAPGEIEGYPFLNQTSATEEANFQAYHPFADPWSMTGQPRRLVGEPTSLRAEASYETAASAASHATYTNGYNQPSYSGHYWPEVSQQAQPYHSGFLSQDNSFASTMASETSTATPTPSSFPFGYWGENQSGPSTSTFYPRNVQPPHQPGPSRTGCSTGRFQPYGMSRTRPNERRNAEAGPSTLVPPPIPHVGPPTPQPSGGISETTADAEKHQTTTEEDKAPVTKPARRPRGQGPPRPYRVRTQQVSNKLRKWVQQQAQIPEAPSLSRALEVAVGIIPQIRSVVNPEPCLRGEPAGDRPEAGTKNADEEFERRNAERRLLQELSRYYALQRGKKPWTRLSLLSNVVKDLEDLSALSGSPDEPSS